MAATGGEKKASKRKAWRRNISNGGEKHQHQLSSADHGIIGIGVSWQRSKANQ